MSETKFTASIPIDLTPVGNGIGLENITPNVMSNLAYRAQKFIDALSLNVRPLTVTVTIEVEDKPCLAYKEKP